MTTPEREREKKRYVERLYLNGMESSGANVAKNSLRYFFEGGGGQSSHNVIGAAPGSNT